jgi:RNA polymerase sigma-70 factor (ECF subfamily)
MDRKEKRRGERIPLAVDIDLFDENDKDMEQVQILYKRIRRLSVFDRAIIMLWLENLSYDEIGQIVGISAKNVSVRLVRIREELKKQ